MNTTAIIRELDQQIEQLQNARNALAGLNGVFAAKTGKRKRTMSAEAKAKISAAQKARWAARKHK